ncbi:Uma2 family endonuclease [Saccharothrix longispora]|uniref:Uma2 family endonuclease n=1 Tax=Saccharothrix longispora TaxID=33920 RepID=UPI0028FD70C6|nr:Uma2 family endonuclease [Saccharothrix longispora]MBY8848142.1 Uma2 family endonuclease [Saccharothrix sp. MB29]MDU0292090.1 Uma2 family endonuclease [Saccharothrix longispora]
MTALPEPSANEPHLFTVAEYAALGEVEFGYSELQEGRILMSPSPAPDHNHASLQLAMQLSAQLPAELEVIQDVDLDLELTEPDAPGFSRRPDLLVLERRARRRVRSEGGLMRASEVSVVIEIVSPGSKRMDRIVKRGEYADAGIPHYWIVDLAEPVSLVACHLAGEFGYQDPGDVTGVFTTDVPFPVRLDLDVLV